MKIFSAPLQGYTNSAWRHFHAEIFGGVHCYFTPFIRFEKGEVRRRDLNDYISELNTNHTLVPQIIFRDLHEFQNLVTTLRAKGANSIDLNLGCPFPPQVHHGRGSGALINHTLLRDISKSICTDLPDISFSVKMRLGVDSSAQWQGALEILNALPLTHITIHPRTAAQQYKGELHLDQFKSITAVSRHPLLFNGDIRSLDDFHRIADTFPAIHGVMIGRGLLARPSLAHEIAAGHTLSDEELRHKLSLLHRHIFTHHLETKCGESQILSAAKPFWDYLEEFIGHKAFKAIKKATGIDKYTKALQQSGLWVN